MHLTPVQIVQRQRQRILDESTRKQRYHPQTPFIITRKEINFKLTPEIINITGPNKNYGILLNEIFERIQSIGIKVISLFMNTEFFDLKLILTLPGIGIDYIMAASSNQRINRRLDEHIKKQKSYHNHNC